MSNERRDEMEFVYNQVLSLIVDLADEPVFSMPDRMSEAKASLVMGLALGYKARARGLLSSIHTLRGDDAGSKSA